VNWLVLFDVDGTLLLTHDEVYVEANRIALEEVFGSAPDGADVPGDTATAHTRRALAAAGFRAAEIDAGMPRWCASFSAHYVELLADADTSHWQAGPGAHDAIASLDRAALLTGNPPPVAYARMERLGLAPFFRPGTGAFGCEREQRVELFALARERAGDWPADRTVAVGDTPLDVSSAHAAGSRCIAVTTGQYARHQLGSADVVIPELTELRSALQALEAG
jgi:phosphoglycolate phosphatase-like HAD superfamily hydrolase